MSVITLTESNYYLITLLSETVQSIYCVPGISRSNKFWSTDGQSESGNEINSSDEWVAEVFWQDQSKRLIRFRDESGSTNNSEVTGADGDYYKGSGNSFFRFKCEQGAEGNVLVGIRKASQTDVEYNQREYLWSFHLWITSYAPDHMANWENEKFVYQVAGGAVHRYADKTENGVWGSQYQNKYIMDRNIGVSSAKADDGIDKTRGNVLPVRPQGAFPRRGRDIVRHHWNEGAEFRERQYQHLESSRTSHVVQCREVSVHILLSDYG